MAISHTDLNTPINKLIDDQIANLNPKESTNLINVLKEVKGILDNQKILDNNNNNNNAGQKDITDEQLKSALQLIESQKINRSFSILGAETFSDILKSQYKTTPTSLVIPAVKVNLNSDDKKVLKIVHDAIFNELKSRKDLSSEIAWIFSFPKNANGEVLVPGEIEQKWQKSLKTESGQSAKPGTIHDKVSLDFRRSFTIENKRTSTPEEVEKVFNLSKEHNEAKYNAMVNPLLEEETIDLISDSTLRDSAMKSVVNQSINSFLIKITEKATGYSDKERDAIIDWISRYANQTLMGLDIGLYKSGDKQFSYSNTNIKEANFSIKDGKVCFDYEIDYYTGTLSDLKSQAKFLLRDNDGKGEANVYSNQDDYAHEFISEIKKTRDYSPEDMSKKYSPLMNVRQQIEFEVKNGEVIPKITNFTVVSYTDKITSPSSSLAETFQKSNAGQVLESPPKLANK